MGCFYLSAMTRFGMIAMLGAETLAMAQRMPEEMPLLQIAGKEFSETKIEVQKAEESNMLRAGVKQSQAHTSSPALYMRGGVNSNSCPHGTHPIHSSADCEDAAIGLGINYDGEESDPLWPADCYVVSHWGTSHVYFNGHHRGTPHSSGQPVCAVALTYHDSYLQGEAKSNYCPHGSHPILFINPCKAAATAVALDYMGEENKADRPLGCYVYSGHSVYHNGHHSGAPHSSGAPLCAQPTNDDSCMWSEDGVCDGPEHCEPGTDCTDCGKCGEATVIDEAAPDNSCIWANNNVCDVPGHCDSGTDCTDCGNCGHEVGEYSTSEGACRHTSDLSHDPTEYFEHYHGMTVAECKGLCNSRSDCFGIEVHESDHHCEVWTHAIAAIKPAQGYSCLQKSKRVPEVDVCLLENNVRTWDEILTMSEEDKRDTAIVFLHQNGFGSVPYLQGKDAEEIGQFCSQQAFFTLWRN